MSSRVAPQKSVFLAMQPQANFRGHRVPPMTSPISKVPFLGIMLAGVLALTSGANGQQDVLPPISKGNIAIKLDTVATGLAAPDYAISAPGDTNRMFVLEQKGQILVLQDGSLLPTPALNIQSLVSPPLVLTSANDERGLLGLAFHPGFNDPSSPGYRTLYTYNSQVIPVSTTPTYITPSATGTTPPQNYMNVVNEWKMSAADSNIVDPASRRAVISFGKNASNHNGGTIVFGPDGYMYLALGDGGNANDVGPSHIEPGGNAQNLSTPLGKMLRFDPIAPSLKPTSTDAISANGQYRIPATNPFQGAGQVPEIYAYGLRNPYRFTFDRANGQLIVADVGQNVVEEIDRIVMGGNYGWPIKEGDFLFNRTTGPGGNAGTVGIRSQGSPAGLIDPITGPSGVLEYDHGDGISITGGFIYHGTRIPALEGKYIFGDLALHTSPTRTDGRLFYADLNTGLINEFLLPQFAAGILPNGQTLHGFGEDARGELYALATNTPSSGTGGVIYKLSPAQEPTLTAPASSSVTKAPVTVTFTLSEVALAGSVRLTFDDGTSPRVLTLAGTQETAATHSFSFNPANPTASVEIASGETIPDGVYTVTLSYRDAVDNPAAPAFSTGVRIDTTPPALTLPANIVAEATSAAGAVVTYSASANDPGGSGVASSSFLPASGSIFALGTTTVNASAMDNAGNAVTGSFTVKVQDTTPPMASVPAKLSVVADAMGMAQIGDLTGNVTRSDAVGVVSVVQSPGPATVITVDSSVLVTFTVSDAAGHETQVQATVTAAFARPSVPAVTAGAHAGQPAPGETVLHAFGPPAISDFRDMAARATLLIGTTQSKLAAIYVADEAGSGALRAYQGGAVPGIANPGVTFKNFLDPVIAPGGAIAFGATLNGGPLAQDQGVWTDAFGSDLELVLREGNDVPGLPAGSKLRSVTSLSLRDGELLVLLTLLPAPGLVTMNDDTVLLRITGVGSATVLLRKGREVAGLFGTKIRTISVLRPALGSPGHGRWQADGAVVAKVGLADGRTMVVEIASDGTVRPLLSTGDPATPVGVQAKWLSFGLPAVGTNGANYVLAATLTPNVGGVMANNNAVLLFSADGKVWTVFAREKEPAPVPSPVNPTLYASFFDPVVNDGGQVAFLATLQGKNVKLANQTGLFGGTIDHLRLAARLGDQAPDEAGTATSSIWSKFTSYALPSGAGAGPIFLGETSGGDTTVKNKLALWGVDSTGKLRRLLRTNATVTPGGPPITGLTLLNAQPGTFGAARSYNATGSVAVLATFADQTQALLRIDLP